MRQNLSGKPRPVKRVHFAENAKEEKPVLRWPRSLPFDLKPPRAGQLVNGRGKTPTYFLAWKFDPHELVPGPGPTGGTPSTIDKNFVNINGWVANWHANPTPYRIPRPRLIPWVGGKNDDDYYFVVYSNHHDPRGITLEDAKYARDALPELVFIKDKEERDKFIDGAFRWYKEKKLEEFE
ncbi:hypothetical protein MKEN_00148700 [Mycena kentingensis (nom. inval.)]|nr:hypothetical protein MKEN_00148700 [Mycena kentingensis (nom. inval.)]